MAKRGRPADKESRHDQYRLRLSEKERSMLNYISEKERMTASDVLRKGILIQYNLAKFD